MSGLQCMLMPLETLPGWPAAPDPTVLQFLGVIVGIPLLLAVVIGGLSFVATNRDVRRFGPPVNPATAYAGAPGLEGGSGAVPAGIEAKGAADTGTGGTSARW